MENKKIKLTLISLVMLLSACGNDTPILTQFKAFDERFTTVIDTKDADQLAKLSELFFDRQEATNAEGNLDFIYLIDVTTAAGSERWGCTKTGYCRQRVEGAAPNRTIFYLERHRELYEIAKLD